MKIRLYPDPVLKQVATPVEALTPAITSIAQDMIMHVQLNEHVAGLAAPQIGQSIRLVVVRLRKYAKAMFNPIIEPYGPSLVNQERCLSLPGTVLEKTRNKFVKVKYRDLFWKEREEIFEDFIARIIQHEVDHLNGKLISDI